MLPKLKRGIRRAKDVLRALFRGRIRKTADPQPEPYLKHADWDGLKLCADVLVENANKSGPLASSVTALSTCIEVFESQVGTHEEYIKLAIDLNDMLCMLSKYFDGARPLEIPQDRVANLSWYDMTETIRSAV
ncbi:hypothetical protein FRC07_009013 [Ceratobasidium sp. 392]|nr:hypothetical protein FRC07_009013 [Ceratobasidium sp. 392]